jgi:hypothetical protein
LLYGSNYSSEQLIHVINKKNIIEWTGRTSSSRKLSAAFSRVTRPVQKRFQTRARPYSLRKQ